MKAITRTVWILSVVSLLTDIASEMLYPVMPLYLKSIGFSIVLIGILEGVSKAWISNITDPKDTATAIGTYAGFQSLCTMLASSLAGLIWFRFGAMATFLVSGIAALLIVGYVTFIPFRK